MSGVNAFRLRSCVWEITLACCFSCRYCGSGGGKARPDELTTEECFDVVRQLAELGCRRVSLIGGEIFLRRDWEQIIRAMTGINIRVAVVTNGFLFTDDLIRRLKAAGVESVAVSLDGPEEIHDRFRQAGSHRRAMNAIDRLSAGNIPVSVITTLHSGNVPLLPRLYETLQEKPIAIWQLQACSPMGNAAAGGMDWRFSFAEVMKFVRQHRQDSPFPLGIADNIGYFTADDGFLRGDLTGRSPFRGCRAGLSAVGIDSVGNVRGCESLYDDRFIEGNLRQRSLKAIWESPESFAYNRKYTPDLLSGSCKGCANACLCAGGCRSYNYYTTGRLYEAPQCASCGI